MHTDTTAQAARDLAIPMIRSILRQRRNAIRHSKAEVLSDLNVDLRRAIKASLSLGLTGEQLTGCTQHPHDSNIVKAIVTMIKGGE